MIIIKKFPNASFFLALFTVMFLVIWSQLPKDLAYDEINIQEGDNLVTLAQQYKGELTTEQWVDLVKVENKLANDTIVVGHSIVVPVSKSKVVEIDGVQLASDE
ncbi:hypothetical protein GCM10007425_16320 [Lysinibacillus alkalisoli]|uniref:LysM peptidoglycan-binding domain-containing protein n=1 Tax=Lysinibacillus alkalisoli TaxID=1911548 RepID=A0A917G5E6_9BACI|nr:hypothetical protein [Lysinibacillus alkalisoli]GGG22590.1 hypothetical protein GCM10007425_16320 [Lysinibacillus alkalisoli]